MYIETRRLTAVLLLRALLGKPVLGLLPSNFNELYSSGVDTTSSRLQREMRLLKTKRLTAEFLYSESTPRKTCSRVIAVKFWESNQDHGSKD
jgi:hypothetical protein